MPHYITHFSSPLGGITLASDGEALTGLWFDGQAHFGAGLGEAAASDAPPVFAQTRRWLEIYFSGGIPDFTPPLKPEGTPFRQRVWRALLAIPYGQTTTYGTIAARLELPPQAARAVGGAVARNPISLIIPCHRVLGANGRLTGYAGGLDKKRALLRLERGETEP